MCVHFLLVSHPWLPLLICCGGSLDGLFIAKERHHFFHLKATRNHIPSPNTITISKPPKTTYIPSATAPQQPTATSFNPRGLPRRTPHHCPGLDTQPPQRAPLHTTSACRLPLLSLMAAAKPSFILNPCPPMLPHGHC